MGFTVPNADDAAFPAQARYYLSDIIIQYRGWNGDGLVFSGGAVSASGADYAITACTYQVLGVTYVATSGTVTPTADASNPRWGLVEVNAAGSYALNLGTASAVPEPPTPTTAKVVLAAVWIPTNDAATADNRATDKRMIITDVNGKRYATSFLLMGA